MHDAKSPMSSSQSRQVGGLPRARLGFSHDMSGMEAGAREHGLITMSALLRLADSSRTLRKGREVPRIRHSDQHKGGGAANVFAPLRVDGVSQERPKVL
jgi:hypothetical protein